MAGGYAELVSVVGDSPNEELHTDIRQEFHAFPVCDDRRSSSDPYLRYATRINRPGDITDNTIYHSDDKDSAEARARRREDNGELGSSSQRSFLPPLVARVLHIPRSRQEVFGFTNMGREEGAFSPVTSPPDRFLASQNTPYVSRLMSAIQSTDDGLRHKNIKMSQHLPGWLWFMLAKSLGIKLHASDKPIFSTFLHVVTLAVAMLLVITGAWYTVRDILSEYSKTTVLIGMVTLVIGFTWILLGVYAHKLAGKLFSNKNFVESVRLHSKTFLKISTTCLMAIIAYACIAINAYDGFDLFKDDSCKRVQLLPIVCHLMYVSKTVYAFLCVSWTMLVGFVLLSVCRTHTIGIRRFMREMAMDAKVYESFWLENSHGETPMNDPVEEVKVDDEWFIWDDQAMTTDVFENNIVTSQNVFLESISGRQPLLSRSSQRSQRISTKSVTISEQDEIDQEQNEEKDTEQNSSRKRIPSSQTAHRSISTSQSATAEIQHMGPPIMSNDDLLFSYWKMSRRLVTTSRFLQRWLSSWIAFTFIWCADYIIFWATHSATITGIAQFVFPLIVLLILCSAYAEVNTEGQRLIRCICPTTDRLSVISFLNQQPLQMQVFSFAITYNAIMGVILAFSVAFASRIVLDEVL